MYVLISDWIPPRERNKLAVFIWSGVQFGTFLELPISGYLSSWLGWESVFYFNGICGIIWCIFYFLLTSNRPSMSNSISTVSFLVFWWNFEYQKTKKTKQDSISNILNHLTIWHLKLQSPLILKLGNTILNCVHYTNILFWILIIYTFRGFSQSGLWISKH